MVFILRLLNIVSYAMSQKFTLEGEASTITMVDEASYTVYNEKSLNFVDSSDIPALTLTSSDSCSMNLDRRMVVHGNLLASTEKSFKIQNYEQWKLVILEDFQGQISGWSEDDISNCGTSPDLFLGGHCKFSSEVVTKTFTLPAHTQIKFLMTFHFLDRWEGETAYLKLDGKYVWLESYQACNNLHSSLCVYKGIDVCGDDYPDRMGASVRFVGEHTSETVKVEVSTTLTRDSCEVSWGIDDIQIFIQ